MALSRKHRKPLKEVYAHFGREKEIDEDPDLALEYLLKGLVKELSHRNVRVHMFEDTLDNVVSELGIERSIAREDAETDEPEAAEAAKNA